MTTRANLAMSGLEATLDLIVGAGRSGQSRVEVLQASDGARVAGFKAYGDDSSLNAPVRLVAKHIEGSEVAILFTAQGTDGRTGQIRRWHWPFDEPLDPKAVDLLLLDQSPGRPGYFLG